MIGWKGARRLLVGLVTAGLALVAVGGVNAPVASAHPQLGSASEPADVRQIDTSPTYVDVTLRSCFRSDGYSDFESVTIQNQFSNSSSRWFHIEQWRADTFTKLEQTPSVNIAQFAAETIQLDGNGPGQDWPKRPNGYEIYAKVVMEGGPGGVEVDWNISPFHQGHNGGYLDTSDTIYGSGTQWDCTS